MMAVYDLLAPHYDAVTGDSAAEAAFIHGLIERRHPQAATLLDLACGTGSITARLAGAYQVSGLDISPGMLALAREKLPGGTRLYLADMTSFRLDASFDVIVCAYQGLNHLLSLAAWQSCFDRACQHLNRGGLFVFDIATLSHLERMASLPRIVQEFAGHYLLIRVRTADRKTFDWHIEVYELQPDGKYRLLTQTIRLTSFPLADIKEALRARFTSVEVISDADGDRAWFACRKARCLPARAHGSSWPGHPGALRRARLRRGVRADHRLARAYPARPEGPLPVAEGAVPAAEGPASALGSSAPVVPGSAVPAAAGGSTS